MRFKLFSLISSFAVIFNSCNLINKSQRLVNEDYTANTVNKSVSPTETYILKYKNLAISEMKRTGIPASITMAQAILESSNGNSTLALKANNHFGIKCKANNWPGATIYLDDDEKNECFRSYSTVEESFRDHSEFLMINSRYKELFNIKKGDYKSWAYGLSKAGYATRRDYADILIDIIEKNKLYELDEGEVMNSLSFQENDRFITVNGLPVVVAKKGDTYESVAAESKIDLQAILNHNEISTIRPVTPGSFIYLKAKKNRARETYHIFRKGDSMYSISQLYGIKVDKLYKLNRIEKNMVPVIGEIVYLKYSRPEAARTITQTEYENILNEHIKKQDSVKENKIIRLQDTLRSKVNNIPVYTKKDSVIKTSTGINKKPDTIISEKVNDNEPKSEEIEYHIVQNGETLFSIARKFNVSVVDLIKINNLSGVAIKVNDTLYIKMPNKKVIDKSLTEKPKTINTADTTTALQNNGKASYDTIIHEVKPGEDLYSISKLYNVNIIDLININKIDVYDLNNGQKMIVGLVDKVTGKNILSKGKVQKEQPQIKEKKTDTVVNDSKQPEAEYHVVQPGETLYRIAVNHKTTIDSLKKLNNLKDNTISVGQKLLIHPAQ